MVQDRGNEEPDWRPQDHAHQQDELASQTGTERDGALDISKYPQELQTKVPDDYMTFYNHGEDPTKAFLYDFCVGVPISHLLTMG